jgi:lipopolysaccharide transport system ATP-binding protein
MHVAIKIENLSKQYRLGLVSTRTLSHDLNRWWQTAVLRKEDPYLTIGEVNDRATKGMSEYVWALRDINLEVQEGEVLGIIGKNGAGKSTLLKILSKVTSPTTGTIMARGRIASLLEVGTGFHPEMTGRENIFMNGAIMGMTKAEITRKFDEIVDFSGMERYIDTPIKRYSSGMMVRLGFAVAAHLEPEILIVDEVLAVGDAEFQKKAIGKMQDISKGHGRTVLFVSHNMAAVKQLCTQGLLLINGSIEYYGNVSDIISHYLIGTSEQKPIWYQLKEENDELFFTKISVLNSKNILTSTIGSEEDFSVEIIMCAKKHIENLTVSIQFANAEGTPILTTSLNDYTGNDEIIENGDYKLKANISKNIFMPGKYKLIVACFISRVKLFDKVENKIAINIENLGIHKKDLDRKGFVSPIYKWEKIKIK